MRLQASRDARATIQNRSHCGSTNNSSQRQNTGPQQLASRSPVNGLTSGGCSSPNCCCAAAVQATPSLSGEAGLLLLLLLLRLPLGMVMLAAAAACAACACWLSAASWVRMEALAGLAGLQWPLPPLQLSLPSAAPGPASTLHASHCCLLTLPAGEEERCWRRTGLGSRTCRGTSSSA